jgi:hypothetical protein
VQEVVAVVALLRLQILLVALVEPLQPHKLVLCIPATRAALVHLLAKVVVVLDGRKRIFGAVLAAAVETGAHQAVQAERVPS